MLGLGLWSEFSVRRMVNYLSLGLGLWSGLWLRRKVNGLGIGLVGSLMVWA